VQFVLIVCGAYGVKHRSDFHWQVLKNCRTAAAIRVEHLQCCIRLLLCVLHVAMHICPLFGSSIPARARSGVSLLLSTNNAHAALTHHGSAPQWLAADPQLVQFVVDHLWLVYASESSKVLHRQVLGIQSNCSSMTCSTVAVLQQPAVIMGFMSHCIFLLYIYCPHSPWHGPSMACCGLSRAHSEPQWSTIRQVGMQQS
jgi:hypothetical protein